MSQSFWKRFTNVFSYNPSTLSGALDVIVVEDHNHIKHSTAFHFRVGKFKVFRPEQRDVNLIVNGELSKTTMKLSRQGIGYFEIEMDKDDLESADFSTDLLQSDEELVEEMKDPKINEGVKNGLVEINELKDDKTERAHHDEEIDELVIGDQVVPDKHSSNNELPGEQNNVVAPEVKRKISTNGIIDDYALDMNEKRIDDDNYYSGDNQIELSLCADLITPEMDKEAINEIFNKNKVNYTKFDNSPHFILNHTKLMIRIGPKIYEPHIGIPQIISMLAYDKELTSFSLAKMAKDIDEDNKLVKILKKDGKERVLKKTLKPDANILESLNLKEGINELIYKFKGNLNKEHTFVTRVFYYPYRPQYRIIVSDIDGTITRSDVLGHLMPFVNQDWSHTGIAELYTNLYKRGYIIVYLTARNIGQSFKTLKYLRSVKQQNYTLPDGPLITSPDTLFESFRREIIIKNPEVFKIQVLRDLKSLFGYGIFNPIYAGFGNKDSDAISYRVVNVPKKFIFTVTPAGDIYMIKSKKTYSYLKLNEMIDEMFPEFDPNESITYDDQDAKRIQDKRVLSKLNPEQLEHVMEDVKEEKQE